MSKCNKEKSLLHRRDFSLEPETLMAATSATTAATSAASASTTATTATAATKATKAQETAKTTKAAAHTNELSRRIIQIVLVLLPRNWLSHLEIIDIQILQLILKFIHFI
jgi:hypothetical protein